MFSSIWSRGNCWKGGGNRFTWCTVTESDTEPAGRKGSFTPHPRGKPPARVTIRNEKPYKSNPRSSKTRGGLVLQIGLMIISHDRSENREVITDGVGLMNLNIYLNSMMLLIVVWMVQWCDRLGFQFLTLVGYQDNYFDKQLFELIQKISEHPITFLMGYQNNLWSWLWCVAILCCKSLSRQLQ